MKARVLPVLNAVGCILLTVLVVVQWRSDHQSRLTQQNLLKQIAAGEARAAEDARHRAALERDIALLKESIEAAQQASENAASRLERSQQINEALQSEMTEARGQLEAWEKAVAQRDERIKTLDEELVRTRKRLEEAIARLREAGAR
jgi:chromosome segregation ATPase